VKRQGHDERIGKCVGDAVHVEESRDLRFAGDAGQAFGEVEDKVPGFAVDEPGGQIAGVADAVGRVAELFKRRLDVRDGVGPVKLRGFVFGEASREIFLPQVVSKADFHGLTLARSASEGKGGGEGLEARGLGLG
jgi:hypothetical protein